MSLGLLNGSPLFLALAHIILIFNLTLCGVWLLTYHDGTCKQYDSSGGSWYWAPFAISSLLHGQVRRVAYPATVSLMVTPVYIRREGVRTKIDIRGQGQRSFFALCCSSDINTNDSVWTCNREVHAQTTREGLTPDSAVINHLH
jgi:hypothetical protein